VNLPVAITKGELLKHLLTGGVISAGSVMAYALWHLVESQPQLVLQVVNGWGPLAAIAIGGMLLVDRRFGQVLDVQRDSTSAHQKLADAVKELADRDDHEREEQRRLLSFVGSQQEKILLKLDQVDRNTQARGAHAG